MLEISFGELLLVFIIGLVALGPYRLLAAIKIVVRWIDSLRLLAIALRSELSQELRLQDFQYNLKRPEKTTTDNLSSEPKVSTDDHSMQ